MRNLEWQSDAWCDYLELQKYDKVLLKKVNNLIKDIVRNGYQCKEGKLEMLKGELSGYASVRIDKKNRLIFKDSEGRITIFACGNHYSDRGYRKISVNLKS